MKTKLLAGIAVLALSTGSTKASIVLNEPFNYADGPLTNVAAGIWNYHSGSGGPANTLNVVSGRAFIHQNDVTGGRDDYNTLLSASFDPSTDNTTKLYTSFTALFTALPINLGTNTYGSYFAHLKSSAANEFYTRVGASTAGAAPGTFRLCVGNESAFSSASPTFFPQDLNLNTPYFVVSMLDLATDQSKLWVNPLLESDLSVTATDGITYSAGQISAYALRQGTSGSSGNLGGPGDLFLDDLKVATSFLEVVPEPGSVVLLALGSLLLLRRRVGA
jgi:hypothetical protein